MIYGEIADQVLGKIPSRSEQNPSLPQSSLVDSLIRAKNALTECADPATGAMSVEDVRAWLDLDDLQQRELLRTL